MCAVSLSPSKRARSRRSGNANSNIAKSIFHSNSMPIFHMKQNKLGYLEEKSSLKGPMPELKKKNQMSVCLLLLAPKSKRLFHSLVKCRPDRIEDAVLSA